MKGMDTIGPLLEPTTSRADGPSARGGKGKAAFKAMLAEAVDHDAHRDGASADDTALLADQPKSSLVRLRIEAPAESAQASLSDEPSLPTPVVEEPPAALSVRKSALEDTKVADAPAALPEPKTPQQDQAMLAQLAAVVARIVPAPHESTKQPAPVAAAPTSAQPTDSAPTPALPAPEISPVVSKADVAVFQHALRAADHALVDLPSSPMPAASEPTEALGPQAVASGGVLQAPVPQPLTKKDQLLAPKADKPLPLAGATDVGASRPTAPATVPATAPAAVPSPMTQAAPSAPVVALQPAAVTPGGGIAAREGGKQGDVREGGKQGGPREGDAHDANTPAVAPLQSAPLPTNATLPPAPPAAKTPEPPPAPASGTTPTKLPVLNTSTTLPVHNTPPGVLPVPAPSGSAPSSLPLAAPQLTAAPPPSSAAVAPAQNRVAADTDAAPTNLAASFQAALGATSAPAPKTAPAASTPAAPPQPMPTPTTASGAQPPPTVAPPPSPVVVSVQGTPNQVASVPAGASAPPVAQASAGTRQSLEEVTAGERDKGPLAGGREERVHGFARGGWTGPAISAYGGRGFGGGSRGEGERGESTGALLREEERTKERAGDNGTPSFTLDAGGLLPEQQLAQPPMQGPDVRPQVLAPSQPVPVTPAQELPDVVFQGRPDAPATSESASISLHHPDLGPIQLEVHREQGRVEVHAVIETMHAQAVLRANENGLRQGVQQAGMTFNALRVRVRGEEQPSGRTGQERRRRGNQRET